MSGYQETSGMAYDSVKPELGKRQRDVLRSLQFGPKTNQEIAEYLNLPINSITPRTNELVKKGIVVEHSRKIGSSGRWAIKWVIK